MGKIRRIFVGFISLFILLSLSACGGEKQNNSVDNGSSISSENNEDGVSEPAGDNDSNSAGDEDSSSEVEIGETTYILTFKVSETDTGTQIVIKSGETMSVNDSRIPSLPVCDEIGYHYAWDKDFSALTESDIVTAVKKAKTYTVYLDARGGALDVSSVTVTFGEKPNIPIPTETPTAKGFMGWYYGNAKLNTDKAWSIDQGDITLNAVWSEGSSWTGDYS